MNQITQPLVTELSSIPEQLAVTLAQALAQTQPTGAWSLRTLVIHLFVVDTEIWGKRLTMMIEQENPKWVWTEPDLAAWEKRFETQTLDELLAEFSRTRHGIVAHLQSLDKSGWARVGTHAVFGQMDVAGLCARILEHDEEHLEELRRRAA